MMRVGTIVWHVSENHETHPDDRDRKPHLKRYRVQSGYGFFYDFENGHGIATDPRTFKPTKAEAWRSYMWWKSRELTYHRGKATKHEEALTVARATLRKLGDS